MSLRTWVEAKPCSAPKAILMWAVFLFGFFTLAAVVSYTMRCDGPLGIPYVCTVLEGNPDFNPPGY